MERYIEASERAVATLVDMLGEDGLVTEPTIKKDIGTIYKLPTQLLLSGREKLCNRVLDTIKDGFLQPDGDFLSYPQKSGAGRKTTSSLLAYNWPYINGWIVIAAQRAGRFDVAVPSFNYLKSYNSPKYGGFLWSEPYNNESGGKGVTQTLCAFMSGHLGYVSLFCGAFDLAKQAGDFLVYVVAKQPNLDEEFLFKVAGDSGEIVTEYPEEQADFFTVKRRVGGQRYYQLGYPVFFLHRLYLATGEQKYLDTACAFLDFALTCNESIYSFPKSHKVAYGAAMIAAATKQEKYRALALRIGENMLSLQAEDGLFLKDFPLMDRLDQTAENAGWLREIYVELSRF